MVDRKASGAIDFQLSTVDSLSVRLGLRYVSGLREAAGKRIAAERAQGPFASIADVAVRCQLRENEMATLAHIGALAAFGLTRREALWQAAAVPKGALFARQSTVDSSQSRVPTIDYRLSTIDCPLAPMSPIERTLADYKGTGITVGPHIMAHLRGSLAREGVRRAADLVGVRNGQWTKIAGLVIVRQRPGTAKGFCFITLEDETGTANAVVVPDLFQRYRVVIHTAAILLIEGPLQKFHPERGRRADGVIHVRARRMRELSVAQQTIGLTGHGYRMRVAPEDEPPPVPPSHDFH